MKFTVETEDPMEVMQLVKSTDMAVALFHIVSNLRKECEHELEAQTAPPSVGEAIDLLFEKIYDILDTNHINIDEIIV